MRQEAQSISRFSATVSGKQAIRAFFRARPDVENRAQHYSQGYKQPGSDLPRATGT